MRFYPRHWVNFDEVVIPVGSSVMRNAVSLVGQIAGTCNMSGAHASLAFMFGSNADKNLVWDALLQQETNNLMVENSNVRLHTFIVSVLVILSFCFHCSLITLKWWLCSFVVASADLSLRTAEVEEKRDKVHKESKALLDYTRKAITKLTELKK